MALAGANAARDGDHARVDVYIRVSVCSPRCAITCARVFSIKDRHLGAPPCTEGFQKERGLLCEKEDSIWFEAKFSPCDHQITTRPVHMPSCGGPEYVI